MRPSNHLIQYSNESATISRLKDNRLIEVNEAFLRTTGYLLDEALGRTPLELGLWESSEVYEEIGRQLTATGMVRQLQLNFRMKSGETRRCLFSAVIRTIDGEECCISFINDITEPLRMEAELRQSERRFRSYVETSSDGFTVLDPTGRITFVAPSVERLLGVSAEEVSGKNFRAFVHPDDLGIAERALDLSDEMVGDIATFRVHRGDASWIWIEGRGSRLPESDQTPGTVFTWRDITERVQKNERLRATEQRLSYIISHAPVVVNEFDARGIMTMSEGSAVPDSRFGPNAIGRSMFEVFAESAEIVETVERVLGGKAVNTTLELSGRWFDVWAEPVLGSQGAIVGGMAVSTDITTRVVAEQRLEAEKEQFRTLVDNSTDIVVLVSRDGTVLFANPAVEEHTGYSPTEFIGRSGLDWVYRDDVEEVLRSIEAAFAHPGVFVNFRFRLRTKNGEIRRFQASGKVLPGYPDRVIVQERDITAIEIYEAELKRARDAAIASVRLQGAFLANMSHEVRTPLNVILGYLDVLSEHLHEQGDTSQDEYLESAVRSGQRLVQTITNVLDYSGSIAGLLKYNPKLIRLSDMVISRVGQFRAACVQKGIDLRFNDEAEDAFVLADEYWVSAAIRSLLDNAVKFTDTGSITIRQFRSGSEICLEISDTGVGIDANFLFQLFTAFVQEDVGLTRKFDGSGLGLALTKRLLDTCNARIDVKSEKGKGSVFTIYFPIPNAVDHDQDPKVTKEPAHLRRPRLLVVEDDPSTQRMMQVLLQDVYDVRICTNSLEVRNELLIVDPPIIATLVDISLGASENGLDIARSLRTSEAFRDLPIIAVTAHASAEHHKRAIEAGCDAVLIKPVLRQKILDIIEKVLRRGFR